MTDRRNVRAGEETGVKGAPRRLRRRLLLADGLCLAAVAAGLLVKDLSRMAGVALTLGGLLCLLVLGLLTALAFLPRCPHCGGRIPRMQLNGVRVRPDRCPRCGAILTDDNLTQ